jgi:hypothetical protein
MTNNKGEVKVETKQPTILELRVYAQKLYDEIAPMSKRVHRESFISRNSRCRCGSGKKWKMCCLSRHEEEILLLEKMMDNYRKLYCRIKDMED